MKQILFALFLLGGLNLSAQITFKTGDSNFDAELTLMNKDANADLKTFKSTLASESNLASETIDAFLKIMQPAEVWLATKIASIAKKPVETVVESYKINKDKGWGEIAKEMGIKPGSAEFHELKGMMKKGKGNSGNPGKGNSKGKK